VDWSDEESVNESRRQVPARHVAEGVQIGSLGRRVLWRDARAELEWERTNVLFRMVMRSPGARGLEPRPPA